MKKRLILIGALVYVVATVFLSIFVIKPVKPIIEIRGEPLLDIAPSSNQILTFAITNTLFSAWVIAALLIIICFVGTRRIALVPSGFYNFIEMVIEAIYNFVTGLAGEKNGRRFFPLIATLFIYIAFANWMSLTPVFNSIGMFVPLHAEETKFHEHAVVFESSGSLNLIVPGSEFVELHADDCVAGHEGDDCREHAIEEAAAEHTDDGQELGVLFPFFRSINTDLMTPAAFALVSVALIQWWGIRSLGFFKYAGKFINFSSPINFFVGFLELIAELAKIISFSFRLFGNMLAGEILLLVMTFLVAVASPILIVFYGLELFVGAIQAFVFGALTLVFAVSAVTAHGPEEHHEGEAEHH